MRKEKTVCIIPAYNEKNTIQRTIEVAIASKEFEGIIVVDDGSKDGTIGIVKTYKKDVVLIQNPKNLGKGQSMINGYKHAKNVFRFDRVMFLDADLMGFRTDHIKDMLYEMDDGCGMVLGHYDWKSNRKYIDNIAVYLFATMYFPIVRQFTGERCLKNIIMDECIDKYSELFQDYGAEIVMNEVCKKMKYSIKYIELDGFYALPKQEKFGFWEGTRKNIKMFGQIINKRIKM